MIISSLSPSTASSSASLIQCLILPPLEGSSTSAWPAAAALVHRASHGVYFHGAICLIEKKNKILYVLCLQP